MNSAPQLRTLLVLGRVSNLPTVWSNCLAGWWLGGGGNFGRLPFLFLGVSLLYTAGMFLNDAFDEGFDRQRRAERPIPSGKISAPRVWLLGFGQLALGIFSCCSAARPPPWPPSGSRFLFCSTISRTRFSPRRRG